MQAHIHQQMCANAACMHAGAQMPHACAHAHAHACRQLYYFLPCTASSFIIIIIFISVLMSVEIRHLK